MGIVGSMMVRWLAGRVAMTCPAAAAAAPEREKKRTPSSAASPSSLLLAAVFASPQRENYRMNADWFGLKETRNVCKVATCLKGGQVVRSCLLQYRIQAWTERSAD